MISLHGRAWFLSSQREVWPCYVPTEENLAKDLLDKNNFPWCYCTRRLLNKRSNLWRERPLWVLFMLSWREFFNRYKSVLCFQRVTILASTFKCWGCCWSAARVALPSLLIGKADFFSFLNIYEKVIYCFRQPSGPNMLLSTHHLHTWYSTTHVLWGWGGEEGGNHQFTHGAGCKICDAWNRVNRVINQLTRALGAQQGGGTAYRMNCKGTECGCFRWWKAPLFLPSGHWQMGLKYPAESQRFQGERLKRLHRNKCRLKRTVQLRAAKFTMSVKLALYLQGLFFSPTLPLVIDF